MTILALDLATRTGYALLRDDGRIESGEERFDLKKHEGPGARYVKFHSWLIDLKSCYTLTRLVYEKVMGHGPFQVLSAHVYGGMLAHLEAFGERHQIPYDGIAVTTIKKKFAGHGAAQKVDMMRQCEALGFKPCSHNEADAIALLHVAIDRCPVLTMNGATPKTRKPKPQPELRPGQEPF